ncbi:upf0669 protein c6orf120 homolog [Plakobranchus ocellatus]|uniref:Upf0669 protein c6orf120 homolog n=1 Tax=Plakobranchus ocellatus TaxID=259542 RepID=A0AAV4CTW1_9GAST|nr:upf0669 protein c6orf120 homolog [Plakobranchus ocellatus]
MLHPCGVLFVLLSWAQIGYSGVTATETRVIQVLEDDIGAENFTHYRLQRPGLLRLELVSLSGDVDIYCSTEVQHPDYNLYDMKSDSCGVDVITIPSAMQRPVYISLFGHPNHILSKFRLTILEIQEAFVEDYEYLVNKYERYYFEEMESEMTGKPKPEKPEKESFSDQSSISDEEEATLPLWWKLLLGILEFGIEVVL